MPHREHLLIVDDDQSTRRSLSLILGRKGYQTEAAGTAREAMEKAKRRFFNAALLDIRLPDMEGTQLVEPLKQMHPDMVVIMITAYPSLETAVRALNGKASACIIKPLDMEEVLAIVREALEKQRLVIENRRLCRELQRELQERKRAEKEKRRLQARLAHAQKMQAVGTLAGGIAHEFNNINTAIIGYVELVLGAEQLSSSARRNLETVHREAGYGAELTESLLEFSRGNAGHKKQVNLKNVVDDVLTATEMQLARDGIEVTVEHSKRVPRVFADPDFLRQVIVSLIINARHAMLKSATKKLTIQTGLEGARPFIRIRDTGCGIPENDIQRVFEPFFTTKGSLAGGGAYDGKIHGTGLGLSVCHSIVEAHGGEIRVKSQVGKGAAFTVYLAPPSARGATSHKPVQKRISTEKAG